MNNAYIHAKTIDITDVLKDCRLEGHNQDGKFYIEKCIFA